MTAPDVLDRWSEVADPETLDAALRRLPDAWELGPTRVVQVRLIKPHQRRCVFQAVLETGSGPRTLIGKAYSRDRSDIADAMAAFSAAGCGPEAECSIPRLYAYLPTLAVRLEEKVEGPSAEARMLQGTAAERADAARRCGRWLGEFQGRAPVLAEGKAVDFERERQRWRTWSEELAGLGGRLALEAPRLASALEAAIPPAGSFTPVAAHGGYIAEHVILRGPTRTVAIDLDGYGAADPDREVAWFVISLQRSALKELGALNALNHRVKEFTRAYREASGRGILPRAGFYRAMECLHRGHRDAFGRVPPAQDWAELMVDEGLRALSTELA